MEVAMTKRYRCRRWRSAGPVPLVAVVLGMGLVWDEPRSAFALVINAPTTFAAADASDASPGDGVFTVVGDLTIATGGTITCNDPADPADGSACDIKIVVTGNME